MRVKFLVIFAALVAMSAIAYAQGAGTWTGEAQGRGRGGPQMVTVVLNADGTGTFKQGDQPEGELSEVMIEGNSVSFQRMVAGPGGRGGNFTLRYAGEVDGDTLVWHRDISEDPKEVGTTSRLKFEVRGNELVIHFTLPNGDRYEWVWRKLR